MADSQTLHSRLRVLVARTFKAEKLYASVRNLKDLHACDAPEFSVELANDIRSREWQRSHEHLRISLNEILSSMSGPEIVKQVTKLRNIFYSHFQNAEVLIERSSAELADSSGRKEYAHMLRLAMDLVRQKARSQACRLISEELSGVLNASGKAEPPTIEAPTGMEFKNLVSEEPSLADDATGRPAKLSNVIPLRRQAQR